MRTAWIGSLLALVLSGCGLLGWGGPGRPAFRDLESGRAMAAATPTVFFSTRVADRGSEVLGVRAEYVIHIAGTCPFARRELESSLRRELFEPSASVHSSGEAAAYKFSLSPEDVAELNANGPRRWITYRLTIDYRLAEGAVAQVHSEYLRTSPAMVEAERQDRAVPINCP